MPQAVMAARRRVLYSTQVYSYCGVTGNLLYLIILLFFRIPVLKGCTTSGEQWIFFVYKGNENGGGTVAFPTKIRWVRSWNSSGPSYGLGMSMSKRNL